MFCTNCGSKLSEDIKFCPHCGYKCVNTEIYEEDIEQYNEPKQEEISMFCTNYGNDETYEEEIEQYNESNNEKIQENNQQKAKYKSNLKAGILCFFLGFLGIHNYYLRRFKQAIIQTFFCVFSITILYLTQIEHIQITINNKALSIILLISTYASIAMFVISIIWWLLDFIYICAKSKEMKSPNRLMIYHSYDSTVFGLLVLIMILLCICGFLYYQATEPQRELENMIIESVKNSILEGTDNTKIWYAVSSMLSYPKWKYESDSIISVEGKVAFLEKPTKIKIKFKRSPNTLPQIIAIEKNGKQMNKLLQETFLLAMQYKALNIDYSKM